MTHTLTHTIRNILWLYMHSRVSGSAWRRLPFSKIPNNNNNINDINNKCNGTKATTTTAKRNDGGKEPFQGKFIMWIGIFIGNMRPLTLLTCGFHFFCFSFPFLVFLFSLAFKCPFHFLLFGVSFPPISVIRVLFKTV